MDRVSYNHVYYNRVQTTYPQSAFLSHLQSVTTTMKREKVKGFSDVLVAREVADGINHFMQIAGFQTYTHICSCMYTRSHLHTYAML